MTNLCMAERTPEKNCNKCEHYKYDVTYGEKCCYAKPDEYGEVYWEPVKEKPKKSYITFSSACG